MIVKEAKEVARQWVVAEAHRVLGFGGAFLHGSVNWLAPDAELSETSDLDVIVVVDEANPPVKPGKFVYRGVLLEVSYLASDQVWSAEAALGNYYLAGSFRAATILLDPTGRLSELAAVVGRDYAKREWVATRCEHAMSNVRRHLRSLNERDAFHDQVTAWLFGTGVTTHVLLVAGLRNPTVRRRYAAAREMLAGYGRLDFHDSLLELLGCARMSRAQVERHLVALANVFDAAKAVESTPFFFASDISDVARPIAIDGSRELIARGLHREAVFWIVATYARCLKVLCHEASPGVRERFDPGFRQLLGDLDIASFADLRRKRDEVERFLPRVSAVADEIMVANPDIEDG